MMGRACTFSLFFVRVLNICSHLVVIMASKASEGANASEGVKTKCVPMRLTWTEEFEVDRCSCCLAYLIAKYHLGLSGGPLEVCCIYGTLEKFRRVCILAHSFHFNVVWAQIDAGLQVVSFICV